MEDSAKTTRTVWKNVYVPIIVILLLVLNKLVLRMTALVEQFKRRVAKPSIPISLQSQILDYKTILDLFENEMMSIKFFWICKESIIIAENLKIEKRYEGGDTVPVTRSSQHLVPLSSSRIGPKLTRKDESFVHIQSISLCDLCIQLILWVVMVGLVDIASGDVMQPHGPWKTYN